MISTTINCYSAIKGAINFHHAFCFKDEYEKFKNNKIIQYLSLDFNDPNPPETIKSDHDFDVLRWKKLSNESLSNEEITPILNELLKSEMVTNLQLEDSKLDSKIFLRFAKMMLHNTSINSLIIFATTIDDIGMRALREVIKRGTIKKLTIKGLSHRQIGDLLDHPSQNPFLESLSFSFPRGTPIPTKEEEERILKTLHQYPLIKSVTTWAGGYSNNFYRKTSEITRLRSLAHIKWIKGFKPCSWSTTYDEEDKKFRERKLSEIPTVFDGFPMKVIGETILEIVESSTDEKDVLSSIKTLTIINCT